MTRRVRAITASALLVLSFNFAGCFDWGGDPCELQQAAPAGKVICPASD